MMRRTLTLPGRLARGLWRFIEPPLKVGRIPFGRTVLLLQLIAAGTFMGYTLWKKDTPIPLLSSAPYELDVMLPDAKGLVPNKEPAVLVAGVPVGKVTKVRVDGGRARVTLRMKPDLRSKVFRDATAFVRPTSVLQTLVVNVDPGTPARGPMRDGDVIAASRTGAYVAIDDLTGTLDIDTQAQVRVLTTELSRAFTGREPELRRILRELGRMTDAATPVAAVLSERRRLLRRLTDNTDQLLQTVGDRGEQLAQAVDLGSRTLAVTARREPELTAAVRDLAPAVAEGQRALRATSRLAEPLLPALDGLVTALGKGPSGGAAAACAGARA